jgi:hypothetical protein
MPGEIGGADDDEQTQRTLIGFATVSGSTENGLRVSLPKATALDEGIEPGDVLRVEHDPVTGAFVYRPSE